MAGRRVYFSFHYDKDIWRASNVRNSAKFEAVTRAPWEDASLWEEAKRKGDNAIRRLIDKGLKNTSVTVVLIGSETASRRWVQYEIEESAKKGNGLIGVRVHTIRDSDDRQSKAGDIPKALKDGSYSIYPWNPRKLGNEVELAAIRAGKRCLTHKREDCWQCRFWNWIQI